MCGITDFLLLKYKIGKKSFMIRTFEVLHCTVLNCRAHKKREPHIFEKCAAPERVFWGAVFYLPKLLSRLFSETKDW